MRDCYAKYLRSEKTRTGQAAKSICRYKTWPWAQQMEAFRSFLLFAPTESNISETNILPQSSEDVNTENEPSARESSSGQGEPPENITGNKLGRKRKYNTTPQSSSVDKIINYLDERHNNIGTQLDEIDLTFQGYAASVKKLSQRRQTIIKFKIAKLIMEEEISEQADIEAQNRPGTSFSLQSTFSSATNASIQSPDDTSSYLCNPYSPPEVSDINRSAATWYQNFATDV